MEQLSIWEMFDEYETPLMQLEEQKKGKKGWIIEFSGIFLKENGFKSDWHGICTRPIVFEEDTRPDGSQWAKTTKGPHMGWCGGKKDVFRNRPTWNDCRKYAEKHKTKDLPKDLRYYDTTNEWQPITRYEDGY